MAPSPAWQGLALWFSFVLPHLATGLFVMRKDCTGDWDKWRLVPDDPSKPRWHKYAKCVPSLARDSLILLPMALALALPYLNTQELPPSAKELLLDCLKLPLAYTVGRIWAMAVHYLLHCSSGLYKAVHKAHHVPLRELCALAAFRDHPVEFLLMEVPGSFLLGPVLLRLQLPSIMLLMAYQGAGSAIDHSGFKMNWLVDGSYHLMHHVNPKVNYGEMEVLDRLMGTYQG